MSDKEIKLLTNLAKRLKDVKLSNEKVMSTFISAGILNKQGDYTKHYEKLKNIVTTN